MNTFLSPGIITENFKLDFAKKPTVAIRGAFVGDFEKGPINKPIAITTTDELIQIFGKPTLKNYNDWYQVRNFLKYYPGCWVVRAANLNIDMEDKATVKLSIALNPDEEITSLKLDENPYKFSDSDKEILQKFEKYDRFSFSGSLENGIIYTVIDPLKFEFIPALTKTVNAKEKLVKIKGATTSSVEIPTSNSYKKSLGNPAIDPVLNNDFEIYKEVLGQNNVNSPLTIYAKSPGDWGNDIKVCISTNKDFENEGRLAFKGFTVKTVFKDIPSDGEYALAILYKNQLKETFKFSLDAESSNYIENIINNNSLLISVKYNGGDLYSTCSDSSETPRPLTLLGGKNENLNISDIATATHELDNKDLYKFDVLIANEKDLGLSAVSCAMTRQDIVAVIGASKENFKYGASETVNNLIKSRLNYKEYENCCCFDDNILNSLTTSYAVYVGNYLKIFDEYTQKHILINAAGDVAGLRAKTNSENGSWYVSAGYKRGVLITGTDIYFNPTKAHRDILYSNNINPIFKDGDGVILMGNRTLDSLESNFSSWHVRQLLNVISVSLENVLKHFLMENINSFTMRQVVSSIQPLLQEIQTNGGLEEYRVRCNETNNTVLTRQNNELHVDVILKPTGAAEFIVLQLVNTGNTSFSKIINNLKVERV